MSSKALQVLASARVLSPSLIKDARSIADKAERIAKVKIRKLDQAIEDRSSAPRPRHELAVR